MDRSTPIYLVKEEYVEDQYGVLQVSTQKRIVFANVTSVSLQEWAEGGRNGLNPEYRVRMFGPDYEGEEVLEIDGVQYAVYRAYYDRTDNLELYVQKRKGRETWRSASASTASGTP